MPVLSSSSVVTSPAASTARPDIASTLRCTSRSIPAIPIADSSAPMVVGMRHTSRAISTVIEGAASANPATGPSASTTTRKTIVRLASRMFERDLVRRLLPHGALDEADHPVDERLAGLARDPHDDRGRDSTRVPPVTALRSPPDSRTTGADSPVIADSSTEAMPAMMSPSPGISSPAVTTTTSPSCRSADATSSMLGVRARPDPSVSS